MLNVRVQEADKEENNYKIYSSWNTMDICDHILMKLNTYVLWWYKHKRAFLFICYVPG